MPSTLSDSPFLALRSDDSCGRHKEVLTGGAKKSAPFSSLSTASVSNGSSGSAKYSSSIPTNGHANGHINGFGSVDVPQANGVRSPAAVKDEFIRLESPQQDVLLLHGPRQRYSLEKAQDIPELRTDREILIQVLAIGLNPVDWKGADFGTFPSRLSDDVLMMISRLRTAILPVGEWP